MGKSCKRIWIAGALIWHGSEMRRFRRLLSPPLQHLLTRPSSSTLGRGAASMTHELARSMGSCQALMHLATDAVQAAVESPFLEDVRAQATGALCCVSLPPGVLRVSHSLSKSSRPILHHSLVEPASCASSMCLPYSIGSAEQASFRL